MNILEDWVQQLLTAWRLSPKTLEYMDRKKGVMLIIHQQSPHIGMHSRIRGRPAPGGSQCMTYFVTSCCVCKTFIYQV